MMCSFQIGDISTLSSQKKKHHWKGLKPNPNRFFGFTYLIVEKYTRRFYVGKRQYWKSKGKVKATSLRPNKDPSVWKEQHWVPQKWEFYTSSSEELNQNIKANPDRYNYYIIGQYMCKADLVYGEAAAQIHYDCMRKKNRHGKKLGYNKQVAPIRFVPPSMEMEEEWIDMVS